jgi:hypothetical protein
MRPGDILIHTDSNGIVRRWRVCGVYLGGEGQESVIEIVSLSHSCPTADGFAIPMYVPEVLLRGIDRSAWLWRCAMLSIGEKSMNPTEVALRNMSAALPTTSPALPFKAGSQALWAEVDRLRAENAVLCSILRRLCDLLKDLPEIQAELHKARTLL